MKSLLQKYRSLYLLIMVASTCLLLIGTPLQRTTSHEADHVVVKLPYKHGEVKVWCKVTSTKRRLGTVQKKKGKKVFTRFKSWELEQFLREKSGKKALKACDAIIFPPDTAETIVTPSPIPTSVNYCKDGIDNNSDGLIDHDDPACWRTDATEEKNVSHNNKIIAYTWNGGTKNPDNFVVMPRFWTWMFDTPAAILPELKALPKGKKVLLFQFEDLWHILMKDSRDYCVKRNSTETYPCIYWDQGALALQQKFDAFFAYLKANNIEVDYLTLDYEGGLSNWHLNLNTESEFRAYMDGIIGDPRWPPVAAALEEIGFADTRMPFNILAPQYDGISYQQWNTIMGKRITSYINSSVFVPAKKYFQNIQGSNFGSRTCKPEYQLPEINGHIECQFTVDEVVGTEQNLVLYGGLGNIRWLQWREINQYPITPFSALRFDLNWVKSAKLSSSIPLSVWYAYREFPTLYHTKDRMSEVALQSLSAGIETVLLWNPRPWAPGQNPADWASDASDREMSAALKEFDMITNGYEIQYEVEKMESWNSSILSSCMQLVGAGRLCRVTLDNECTDTDLSETEEGVQLKACGQTRLIPAVRIWRGSSMAPLGLWLTPAISH